jgi:Zn-dependent M28 family amino/carboxypeptidase
VIVVFFDQEEIGLVGSDAFAAFLVAQGLDVVAAHTIDQMGWDADGDRTVELERADPGLFRLYDAASSALPAQVPLTPTDTGFTDHVSFRAYGFDAIGLTEEFVSGDTTPHYHLPSDTFATVDLEYLHSSTRLVLQTFGDLTAVP